MIIVMVIIIMIILNILLMHHGIFMGRMIMRTSSITIIYIRIIIQIIINKMIQIIKQQIKSIISKYIWNNPDLFKLKDIYYNIFENIITSKNH